MMSIVKKYSLTISEYLRSMKITVDRASRKSTVEDDCFLKKLESLADLMGYGLHTKEKKSTVAKAAEKIIGLAETILTAAKDE